MTPTRQSLCIFYGLVALVALVGTWGNNIQYLNLGFLGANLKFWQDTLANPASRSITVDLLLLFVAVAAWMLMEARRLGMKGGWLYVIFGILIAISVTFPLFMLNRERALAQRDAPQSGSLSPFNVAILLFSGVVACGYTVAALTHP